MNKKEKLKRIKRQRLYQKARVKYKKTAEYRRQFEPIRIYDDEHRIETAGVPLTDADRNDISYSKTVQVVEERIGKKLDLKRVAEYRKLWSHAFKNWDESPAELRRRTNQEKLAAGLDDTLMVDHDTDQSIDDG